MSWGTRISLPLFILNIWSMKLNSNEVKLDGHWILKKGEIVKDETANRIDHLINNYLTKITTDASG
jgi:hypothetical protein